MPETLSFETYAIYFSNFSGHMLEFNEELYTTAEHAYHCQRYDDLEIIDEIKNARSAIKAWEVSQKYKKQQKPEWEDQKIPVMQAILRAKVEQHEDVRKALLESGDAIIVKNQALDAFWGNGPDGNGRNEMGKLWMKIRETLR